VNQAPRRDQNNSRGVAGYVPARRASSVNPSAALRSDV